MGERWWLCDRCKVGDCAKCRMPVSRGVCCCDEEPTGNIGITPWQNDAIPSARVAMPTKPMWRGWGPGGRCVECGLQAQRCECEKPLTTQEWMALPLTVEDVDHVEKFLTKQGGLYSTWPWPTIHKVLDTARKVAQRDDTLAEKGE